MFAGLVERQIRNNSDVYQFTQYQAFSVLKNGV